MRIAVDAMGGDHAPAVVVDGALRAHRELGIDVILVGDDGRIRAELLRLGAEEGPGLAIHHASQVVEMGESASQGIRTKKDASIRVALELVKRGEADAALSAGNSGAVLAASLLILGRLPGVERPAVVAFLPTLQDPVTLLDAGANVDVKPLHLVQFALLGEVYARRVLQIPRPRVGVLSNGEEHNKGTLLTRSAMEILRQVPRIDFRGYAEAGELFGGGFDVVATDGFTGNAVLKTAEAAAVAFGTYLKKSVESSVVAKLGAAMMRPSLGPLLQKLDYAEVGGAPLIGCDGTVLMAHGRSDARAIRSAIRTAADAAAVDIRSELSEVCAAVTVPE